MTAAQIRFLTLIRREINRFMKIRRQTVGAPLLETFLYISVFGAALKDAQAWCLEWARLTERAGDTVASLSGGMKRRLNLAAGLIHRPRVILMDEPTVGVDPQSRNHIFEEVRRLNATGVTILYTSHYMEEVQALCPRVGVMDHGRLVACGAASDLLRQLNGLIRIRVPWPAPGPRPRPPGRRRLSGCNRAAP